MAIETPTRPAAYAAPGFSLVVNVLLLLPRLLGAALRVQAERLFVTRERRLKKLTSPAWLAEKLGIEARLVKSASIEEVHTGTASRSRLWVRYAEEQGEPVGPSSLFIKSSPPDFGSSLFGVLFGLGGNEVDFYRRVRPDLTVRSPKVFYSEGNSNHYVILLEDLTDKGCDFRTLASSCSLDEARKVITTLGTLHAGFWESPRFSTDLAWVRRLESDRDFRLLDLVRQLSVPIACQKYSASIPGKIVDLIPHLMKNYRKLEAAWAQGPRTLLHGDAHLGNMYVQEGEVGLLDWQVFNYGQGMRDISYLLVNSLDEKIRLDHQEKLVRHYLAVLADHGVSLAFDVAWRQYRMQSVYAWIAGAVTAPSNFQPESVVSAGLARASNAVLDLDALGLIRKL
ncbi:MAG: phosphotransferase [Myxococcota bacterium]|nr:phosphotransferase [Myxococcota bacterium]